MKRVLLGMSIFLSLQMFNAFAEEEQQFKAEKFDVEQVESLQAVSEPDILNLSRARSDGDWLPRVGKVLSSTSASVIFADGTIADATAQLVVLNKGKNLAKIRIAATPVGGGGFPIFIHEFLLGLVGSEYFGSSVDAEGGIVLERVSRKHIEVTYTRIDDSTGLTLQVRARFKI